MSEDHRAPSPCYANSLYAKLSGRSFTLNVVRREGHSECVCLCVDVDECAEPSQCPGQMCVNSVGSYRCATCGPGYTLTNRQCTGTHTYTKARAHTHTHIRSLPPLSAADVDECVGVGVCEAERVCVNTVGSFRCECASGYQTAGPGRKCRGE